MVTFHFHQSEFQYNCGSAQQFDSELTSWHSEVSCMQRASVVPKVSPPFDEARHLAPLFYSPKDRLILPPHRRLFTASATTPSSSTSPLSPCKNIHSFEQHLGIS